MSTGTDTVTRVLRLLALLQARRFWSGGELADHESLTFHRLPNPSAPGFGSSLPPPAGAGWWTYPPP
ncbi:hypothetical protein IDM40_04235 [Nocardiopsis sp. HNM0947]|uniref:Uncharacterized protein n=1 Tax=Nocardiopsis coralli TaxID=2772213 RepID=A0ABR9P2D5_9ACTN|nr:hypothetical protein [Nocardiopsis coralli]MBE2997920.1 hypothetical protein [Nocardiopsis coralli]